MTTKKMAVVVLWFWSGCLVLMYEGWRSFQMSVAIILIMDNETIILFYQPYLNTPLWSIQCVLVKGFKIRPLQHEQKEPVSLKTFSCVIL